MTNKQREKIYQHGLTLIKIFSLDPKTDPIALCKALRVVEGKMHKAAEDLCNLPNQNEAYDKQRVRAVSNLDRLLGFEEQGIPVFINSDPRGYALKVQDRWMKGYKENNLGPYLPEDWGGYGLLAPDFSPVD